MAGTYHWCSYAFVPLAVDDGHWREFDSDQNWEPWHVVTGGASEDIRRFFIPAVGGIVCPTGEYPAAQRWVSRLEPDAQPYVELRGEDSERVYIKRVELVKLPVLSVLIIELSADNPLEQDVMVDANRVVFEWLPRSSSGKVTVWNTLSGEMTLASWLLSVLPRKLQSSVSKSLESADWFGHQLPNFTIVREQWDNSRFCPDSLVVHLLSGIPLDKQGYRLEQKTAQEILRVSIDQYWDDWFFGNNENRYLAVLSSQAGEFVESNLSRHYMPIVCLVIYQKIMVAQLLEKYLACGISGDRLGLQHVREAFTRFRHRFGFQRITSYPLGQRIYSFMRKRAEIDDLIGQLFEQIEATDNYEHLQIERREAKTFGILTWLAALALPITTAATVFALDASHLYEFGQFWITSSITTIVVVLVVLTLQIRGIKRKQS